MEVQDLVNFAKESQGMLKWDTASLIRVGGQLAVKVNAIKNLSGQEKQKLICQVLKVVLEDVEKKEKAEPGKTDDEKTLVGAQFERLRQAVDDVVPASLDLAISAARGKLDLKKVKMSVWVRYFSCCARSVVTALVSNNVISQAQAKQAADALAAVETKAAEAAEKYDAEKSQQDEKKGETVVVEEDKTKFEQKNPMHAQVDVEPSQEAPKTE